MLILDEPTNDLDIATLQILEDYLDSYQGIVITVSHDRYFLDRVVGRIFALEGNGRLRQHEGGYTDYENRLKAEREAAGLDGEPAGSISMGKDKSAGKQSIKTGGTAQAAAENEAAGNAEAKDPNAGRRRERKLKFSYMEQREYETIDADIAALEAAIKQNEADMSANATNSAKLTELTKKQTELEEALEAKTERWFYLNELAEKIASQ